MTLHITDFRDGFPMGTTQITHEDDSDDNVPITLEVMKLAAGEEVHRVQRLGEQVRRAVRAGRGRQRGVDRDGRDPARGLH